MGNVIFARPRFHYQSYTDLLKLIELAGYPLIYLDEIDPSTDDTYICTLYDNVNDPVDSGVWAKGWPEANAQIILLDLEWHIGDNRLPPVPGLARIWAADKWYAEQINVEYVPLGSDPRLAEQPFERSDFQYDVAPLSYNAPPRRQRALQDMQAHGLTLAPNGWGMERHEALTHSKVMVNIHQWDHLPVVSPQRFAVAAAYKMPLITEEVADQGIFTSDYILHMPRECSPGIFVGMAVAQPLTIAREACGEALYQLLCEDYGFKKVIEAAV